MKLTARSVQDLVLEQRKLEQQIKKLDRRGHHLTPNEQVLSAELKKLRLLAKDKLTALGKPSLS